MSQEQHAEQISQEAERPSELPNPAASPTTVTPASQPVSSHPGDAPFTKEELEEMASIDRSLHRRYLKEEKACKDAAVQGDVNGLLQALLKRSGCRDYYSKRSHEFLGLLTKALDAAYTRGGVLGMTEAALKPSFLTLGIVVASYSLLVQYYFKAGRVVNTGAETGRP